MVPLLRRTASVTKLRNVSWIRVLKGKERQSDVGVWVAIEEERKRMENEEWG